MNSKDLSSIVTILQNKLTMTLPGVIAHNSMLSYDRPTPEVAIESGNKPRLSAVNIVLHLSEGEIYFPLIKRPEYPGVHSSQIAFPGGKLEDSDESLWHAAKRETFEEIGISQEKFNLIGELSSLYIPPSNYIVHPFISFTDESSLNFNINPKEVDKVVLFPIKNLHDKSFKTSQKVSVFNGQLKINVPGYSIENEFIWGATAMILKELEMILSPK